MPVIKLAHAGQGQFSGRTLQQAHAKTGLKLGDPARQPGFGDIERAPRRRETTPRDDFGEIPHIVQICHTSRSEEHTSELQSLMRISYAAFCLKKKINTQKST